jgi:hypothetical protein
MTDDIIDRSEVVIAFVREDGRCETVGSNSGFCVSPRLELVDVVTASVERAATTAHRAMQRRDGKWRALLATLPSIRVNTLGDTFSPNSEDDWSYRTEFPIRIYLERVED